MIKMLVSYISIVYLLHFSCLFIFHRRWAVEVVSSPWLWLAYFGHCRLLASTCTSPLPGLSRPSRQTCFQKWMPRDAREMGRLYNHYLFPLENFFFMLFVDFLLMLCWSKSDNNRPKTNLHLYINAAFREWVSKYEQIHTKACNK